MGVYKISSPVLDPEVLEDLGGIGTRGNEGSDESLKVRSKNELLLASEPRGHLPWPHSSAPVG